MYSEKVNKPFYYNTVTKEGQFLCPKECSENAITLLSASEKIEAGCDSSANFVIQISKHEVSNASNIVEDSLLPVDSVFKGSFIEDSPIQRKEISLSSISPAFEENIMTMKSSLDISIVQDTQELSYFDDNGSVNQCPVCTYINESDVSECLMCCSLLRKVTDCFI